MLILPRKYPGQPLGVLLVLYGYFAYTFGRYPSAPQKLNGVGMVTPTFSGQ